jgi:hypothetical protein
MKTNWNQLYPWKSHRGRTDSCFSDMTFFHRRINKRSILIFDFFSKFLSIFLYLATLWHLQKCLHCILVKFTPTIILLYPPSNFLRIVSTGFIISSLDFFTFWRSFPFVYATLMRHFFSKIHGKRDEGTRA